MAGSSGGLLRIFASTIKNASALASEMKFTDLHAAFTMTSELQQRIVDLILVYKQQMISLETNPKIKPEPGDDLMTQSPEVDRLQSEQSNATVTCCSINGMTSDHLSLQAAQEQLINTNEDSTGDTVNSNLKLTADIQQQQTWSAPGESSCDNNKPVTNYTEHNKWIQTHLSTPKHRLVSIESLYPDGNSNGDTGSKRPCAVCQFRLNSDNRMLASMACPACSDTPPICSAQCFRWWHSHFSPSQTSNHLFKKSQVQLSSPTSSSHSRSHLQTSNSCLEFSSRNRKPYSISNISPSYRTNKRRYHRRKLFSNSDKKLNHQIRSTSSSVWSEIPKSVVLIKSQRSKRGRPRKMRTHSLGYNDFEWMPY